MKLIIFTSDPSTIDIQIYGDNVHNCNTRPMLNITSLNKFPGRKLRLENNSRGIEFDRQKKNELFKPE